MADLVPAVWNGPFPAERADGSTLNPGDQALVTEGDLLSGHWKRVPKSRVHKDLDKPEGDS